MCAYYRAVAYLLSLSYLWDYWIIMSYRLLTLAGALFLQLNQLYQSHLKRTKKLKLLHRIIEILPLTPSQLAKKIAKVGST